MKTLKKILTITLATLFVIVYLKCDSYVMNFIAIVLIGLIFIKLMNLIGVINDNYIENKFFK